MGREMYGTGEIRPPFDSTKAQELAEDCGLIPDDAKWPCNCIDWEQAAEELQVDYSTVEYDGETYYYR